MNDHKCLQGNDSYKNRTYLLLSSTGTLLDRLGNTIKYLMKMKMDPYHVHYSLSKTADLYIFQSYHSQNNVSRRKWIWIFCHQLHKGSELLAESHFIIVLSRQLTSGIQIHI
jgi:hypothetical protein